MNRFLCSENYVEQGDYIWFSAVTHNGIYRIHKSKHNVELVTRFPDEKGHIFRLYRSMIHWRNFFIFAPCAANDIAIFDYDRNIFKQIPLKNLGGDKNDPYSCLKFWDAILYRDDIYFLGTNYPAIVRLNLITEELIYYTECIKWIASKAKDHRYFSSGVIRGNLAYIPCFWTSAVLIINLDTYLMKIVDIKSQVDGFYGISDDGVDFWLSPHMCQSIVRWNPDSGFAQEIDIPYTKTDDLIPFHSPIIDGESVYLFPLQFNDMYIINRKTGAVQKDVKLTKTLCKENNNPDNTVIFNPKMISHGKFLYIDGQDYSWHIYNYADETDQIGYLEITNEDYEYIQKSYIGDLVSSNKTVRENQEISLDLYLKYLIEIGCLKNTI